MNVKPSQAAEESPSRPVEEDAATSSFAEVARIITGDDEPPPWLVQTFEMWASSLATDRAIARQAADKSKNAEESASRHGCGTHAD